MGQAVELHVADDGADAEPEGAEEEGFGWVVEGLLEAGEVDDGADGHACA